MSNPTPTLVRSIKELRVDLDRRRASGQSIGVVPTMGYLHDGHASLIRAARAACDYVMVSICVNPLQFAEGEDLSTYPKNIERDTQLCGEAGADLLFVPSVEEMYPDGPVCTSVEVPELAGLWEGATRPEHFAGVCTVVSKLFFIAGPCSAFFGEKDFQQLSIIRRMVRDLSVPVTVVGCPTVRDHDGLAMSSRNSYLTDEERVAAPVLRRALDAGLQAIAEGERSSAAVVQIMADVVADEPLAALDYAAAVDAATLVQHPQLTGSIRLLIAAQLGRPRLIDNAGTDVGAIDASMTGELL
mgnify:CR=1 FL=1